MFLTIMIEVGLYITKTLKSDLITQKAQRIKKTAEQKKFDDYYNKVKTEMGAEMTAKDPRQGVAQMSNDRLPDGNSEFEAKNRDTLQKNPSHPESAETLSKKDK
jgi:hypothetical protein